MTLFTQFALTILRSSLALYPARYRHEYGEERACVLQLTLEDAGKDGWLRVVQVCARELRDLPLALLREHYKEWRAQMKGVRHSIPPGEWGLPGYKLALFLIPFLIVLIVPVANWIRLSFPAFASVGLLAIVSLLIIIGLVKGLPGWSLPSVGLGMGIAKLLVFTQQVYGIPGLIQLHTALWTDSILQRVLYVLIVSFLNWIPVMVLLALLGLLCIWLPGLPILRQRFERDWTLLPFLLYATNVLTFLYADAYRRYEPYELLFVLILAGGAWYYLWTSQLRNRLIALLVATLLSGLVLALGIYQIYPLQTWANDVARDFSRWWETIQPLLDTVALLSGLGLMAIFGTLVLQDKVKAHN